MSQDYAYACERAELLGLPAPTEEEWRASIESQKSDEPNPEETVDDTAKNLDSSDDTAQRISGGLDELNSILTATQKKLNRFKTVCGSIGTLLKGRVTHWEGTPNHKPNESSDAEEQVEKIAREEATDESMTIELSGEANQVPCDGEVKSKSADINKKMASHLDKLDSLINKAENAQYSMQHQTKQMRSFLK
ncbi:uncharacterized protein [Prorops nasuta]|uniref:uncharacterized protein n=1 Tax=Prorops nasuta TaxID=863751 RepID=UPI0034CEBB89